MIRELLSNEELIVREAVRRLKDTSAQTKASGTSRNGYFTGDSDGGTTPGDDGSGNVTTLHPFIWGLDTFGDATAVFGDVLQV